jgi:uncharacterized peroxidase-related enzyme
MKFTLHDMESAPEATKDDLAWAEKTYGAIPNLYRGFAANPATLKIYLAFNELLKAHGQLSPIEQQLVYLTISAENSCTYCVGAHSVLANMVKMPADLLDELRSQQPLSDPKLNQLREFTLSLMQHRGHLPEADLAALVSVGYEQGAVLEVLTILAQKTLSNYFNHLADTPLDEMFMSQQWTPKAQS